MIAVAGGIILAFIALVFFREILAAVGVLIAVALVLGAFFWLQSSTGGTALETIGMMVGLSVFFVIWIWFLIKIGWLDIQ